MSGGQLEQRIDIRSGDELGMLADAFNRMSATIRTQIAEQHQANNNLQRLFDEVQRREAEQALSELRLLVGELVLALGERDELAPGLHQVPSISAQASRSSLSRPETSSILSASPSRHASSSWRRANA